MDLPPLITRIINARTPITSPAKLELVSLAEYAGSQLSVVAEEVTPLQPQLRQQLLAQIAQWVAQSKISPALAQQIQTAPNLLAAKLQTQSPQNLMERLNPVVQQPIATLLAISATPLRAGAPLSVHIGVEGMLHLLPLGVTETSNAPAALLAGLRQYRSYSEPLTQPVRLLSDIQQHLLKIPTEHRTALLSPRLESAVVALLQQPPTAGTINATKLEHLFRSSGLYLENNLAQLAYRQPAAKTETASHTPLTSAGRIPDLKQALLSVFSSATQEATRLQQTAPTPPQSLSEALASAGAQIKQSGQLLQYLQQLAGQTGLNTTMFASVIAKVSPDLPRQLAALIQAAAALGLARISSNQLQQLSRHSQEPGALMQSQVEFFVRTGAEQLMPVNLHIEERRAPPQDDTDQKESRKRKSQHTYWRVFMELTLRDNSQLATEITFQDERLRTRMWSDSSRLQQRATEQLDQLQARLEASGIQIDGMTIEAGPPPAQPRQTVQQLIDVRT
ncbi:flagellar hook-length control protein FliK [Teredinibacter turnerae]|uniref:flagellar hook-length control protein FliK n=1 Tax=Teredinibacter turnerae TaxID=2426 RepID=UPI00048BF6D1|nr:flagellar hook-length control protein FliK [Teredinibacter turnerae]